MTLIHLIFFRVRLFLKTSLFSGRTLRCNSVRNASQISKHAIFGIVVLKTWRHSEICMFSARIYHMIHVWYIIRYIAIYFPVWQTYWIIISDILSLSQPWRVCPWIFMRVLSLLWQCSCREPSVGTSAVPLVAKEGPPGHGLSHQFFLVDHQNHAKKANCLAGMVAPMCRLLCVVVAPSSILEWPDTPHQGEVPFAYQALSATLGREPIGLVNTAQEEQLRGRMVEGRQRTRVVGMAWIARFGRKFYKVLVPSESSERCNK